jgi:Fe-S cluster assembly protein SufD
MRGQAVPTNTTETTVFDLTREHYLRDLRRLAETPAPSWLGKLRAGGEKEFAAAVFPHTKMEEWRETNLTPLVESPYYSITCMPRHNLAAFDTAPHRIDGWINLVFVDGFFDAAISDAVLLPNGAQAGSLAEAMTGPAEQVVRRHLGTCLGGRSAYTALNTAFLQDGPFLYVPKGVELDRPVHFLCIATERQPNVAAHYRSLIVLDAMAKASVAVTSVSMGAGEHHFDNVVEEIVVGDGAALTRCEVIDAGEAGRRLCTTETRQGRDSRFDSFSVTLGGAIVRNQLCVLLGESGAEAHLNGLYLNADAGLVDNNLHITHGATNCVSRIAYKGVLDGTSRSVFTGRVLVVRDAQKTDSVQLNNNLLLSETARVETRPQLEIYADDVKCTHGATVGPPPPEIVFYFRSRGVDEKTARGMLTYGFAEDLAGRVPDPALRKRLDGIIYRRFSPGING